MRDLSIGIWQDSFKLGHKKWELVGLEHILVKKQTYYQQTNIYSKAVESPV